MSRDDHYRKLERLYLGAPTNAYYRPSIQIGEGRAEIEIAVRPEFMHAAKAVHGSVYFKLLDDACFFAVNSLVEDVFVLTTSFNLYLSGLPGDDASLGQDRSSIETDLPRRGRGGRWRRKADRSGGWNLHAE
jgi:hypothetical protein